MTIELGSFNTSSYTGKEILKPQVYQNYLQGEFLIKIIIDLITAEERPCKYFDFNKFKAEKSQRINWKNLRGCRMILKS